METEEKVKTPGISFYKRTKKWLAYVYEKSESGKSKQKAIGYFKNEEEAIEARIKYLSKKNETIK